MLVTVITLLSLAFAELSTASAANQVEVTEYYDTYLIYQPLPNPEDSKFPGGYCQDGSRAGYFIREGKAESNDFVIYLAGGGGCNSKEECDARGPSKRSNSTWNAASKKKGGFLDADCTTNPTFCDATAVHIPYCTSDAHRGNNTEINEWGYYFDGHANFAFIVEELIEKYGLGETGINVMLTGGSAGGIGAIYNVDWLANRLDAPESATVKVVSSCGWYFPNALPSDLPGDIYPPSDYSHFANGTKGNDIYDAIQAGNDVSNEALFKYNDLLPEECLQLNEQTPGLCLSASNFYKFLKSPMFLSHTQYDSNQLFSSFGAPKITESEEELEMTESYIEHYGAATRASFDRILAGDHFVTKAHPDGLFSASCITHGTPNEVTIGDGNISWQTIAGDWFFQLGEYTSSHQLIEDCGSRTEDGKTLPCNTDDRCKFPFPDPVGKDRSVCLKRLFLTGCLEPFGNVQECKSCLEENAAEQNLFEACESETASKVCLYASRNDLSDVNDECTDDNELAIKAALQNNLGEISGCGDVAGYCGSEGVLGNRVRTICCETCSTSTPPNSLPDPTTNFEENSPVDSFEATNLPSGGVMGALVSIPIMMSIFPFVVSLL